MRIGKFGVPNLHFDLGDSGFHGNLVLPSNKSGSPLGTFTPIMEEMREKQSRLRYQIGDTEPMNRRQWLSRATRTSVGIGLGVGFAPSFAVTGCVSNSSAISDHPDLIIGQRGMADGRFQKPRAMAIDAKDRIVVIDKTARVQVFDDRGNFLRGWETPSGANGKPTGVSIDSLNGHILVADTHYFQFLTYTFEGQLLADQTIGGVNGSEPGQFGWVTDIVRAPNQQLYMAEYGEFDRIYKYSSTGEFIDRFGEHGDGPLQFSRPQSIAVDEQGFLWIADSCNHRIQVVDWTADKPRSVAILGTQGVAKGELQFPYGMTLVREGVLIAEYGNHRVQLWDRNGRTIASWGQAGSRPGELNQPWAVATDSKRRIYVVDSGNNRVQRFMMG